MTKTQLQAVLAIAAIGAGLALGPLLRPAGELVGVGLLVICTILTAPAAPEQGSGGVNWWALLAGGTALALIGVPVSLVLEAPGGLLTAIGGGMAILGVVFGMPT